MVLFHHVSSLSLVLENSHFKNWVQRYRGHQDKSLKITAGSSKRGPWVQWWVLGCSPWGRLLSRLHMPKRNHHFKTAKKNIKKNYLCWLVGSQPKFKAREVLVQQIAKGKQGLFLEDVASWVATRCPPILEWKKGNGNEICQGLWPNEVKTLCPYVLSTCDASNECVAWSAIDTERKGVKEKTFKSHMSGSQYMIVLM